MKIPSNKFWLTMGTLHAAVYRLKEINDKNLNTDDILDEELRTVDFLCEHMSRICDSVYQDEIEKKKQ